MSILMTTEPPYPERYLGDGVYASFDGYHIVLDLRGQDNTTRIALEPRTCLELVKYKDSLYKDLFGKKPKCESSTR